MVRNGKDTDQNKVIVEHLLKGLDEHTDIFDEFVSPDCLVYLPGSNLPVDREGFKQFIGMLYAAFPDLHHKVERQIEEGNEVASLVSVRGNHEGDFQGISPTGRRVTFTDIIIARIENGKLVMLWAQFDALGLLQQLSKE